MTETDAVFASTVDYYARFRTGYPPARLAALADQVGLDASRRLLDIGCGPGQIAVAMARYCLAVTAIDPVAAMLDHGRAAARNTGVANITWLTGHSRDLLGLVEPGAHTAIFAASFHWTDRADVLATLDRLLAPGGSVVIITDTLAEDQLPDWDLAITEIRTRYLGRGQPQLDAYLTPVRSDREILESSPFPVVDAQTWTWERSLTVEEVVGLQFSYSFSSPVLFGPHQVDFAQEVNDAVLALHPAGVVTELFCNEVLVATRPG